MADFMNSMIATMQVGTPLEVAGPGGPFHKTNNPNTFAGLTSVVGGLADIAGGKAEASRFESEARQLEDEATQEQIAGQAQVIDALKAMNTDLAQITVASAASGVSGQGSTLASFNEAEKTGERNVRNIKANTGLRSSGLRGGAIQKRAEAKFSKISGKLEASMRGMDFFARNVRRG